MPNFAKTDQTIDSGMNFVPTGLSINDEEEKPSSKGIFSKGASAVVGNVAGAIETGVSLATSMVLWPLSKVSGVGNLLVSADRAREQEEYIQSFGYQPRTKEGKAATELIGKGMEVFLAPARKARELLDPISPTLGYLGETAVEVGEFLLLGKAGKGAKAKFQKTAATVKARAEGAKVMRLIRKRRSDIDSAFLDSEAFVNKIENSLSPHELEAVPFLRQKIKDPQVLKEIGKENVIPTVENPSPKLLRAVEKIGQYYDEAFSFLKENGSEVSFIEDYVTQIWDIPKGRKSEVVSYFATRNPFAKKRTIPSLEEGIKLGLKPKTTNIAEMLRIYDQFKIKTVYNLNFAERLKKLIDEDGSPLVMRIDKAPTDWVEVNHPALNKVMMTGKTTKQVKVKDTTKTIRETIDKIKTIERETPGGTVAPSTSRQIQALEGVVQNALESRGMTQGEAGAYLHRLRRTYAGAEVEGGIPVERVSESVASRRVSQTLSEIEKKFPVDVPILSKVPVRVHPDIASEVKIIFDDPFSHKAITAFETTNAFLKKSMLSVSFFHHHALTESAFSTGIGRKAVALWNPIRIVKELRNKNYAIYQDIPLAKDSIKHGVSYGPIADVQKTLVHKALKSVERRTADMPIVKHATKGIRKANQIWDAALWDYYHNSLKLYAYEHNVYKSLKGLKKEFKRPLTEAEITAVKRSMAEFVNDSFGGQNWELNRVLGKPKTRQMLHWGLLAPDWTLSTAKQAAAPVRGLIQGGVKGKALAKQGTKFWLKAGIYFNIIAQSANYYNTKKEYGEGRLTSDNPPGHKLNIFIGRNKDGTERYLRMGKQFREVLEFFENPVRKVGGKMSPLLRETMRQFTAHDPGSGYPAEFSDKEGWENLSERAKSAMEMPLPFSLRPYVTSRPGNFLFTFPTSKGMTNYKTVDLFKKALRKLDREQIKKTYIQAIQNNLDAESLFKSAKSSIKADITYNNNILAREIYTELQSVPPDARSDLLNVYKQKGILTPNIISAIDKWVKRDKSIAKQRELIKLIK